jgi:hypothetical protein
LLQTLNEALSIRVNQFQLGLTLSSLLMANWVDRMSSASNTLNTPAPGDLRAATAAAAVAAAASVIAAAVAAAAAAEVARGVPSIVCVPCSEVRPSKARRGAFASVTVKWRRKLNSVAKL